MKTTYNFLSLSGPCHTYVQQRGRTGGWMDAWCDHDMKIGAKMEAMQESVSDIRYGTTLALNFKVQCFKEVPKASMIVRF